MLENYLKWPELFEEAKGIEVPEVRGERVVYTGMGGSYIPGKVAEILDFPVDYASVPGIPRRVDEKTVVIAVSYSGTTGETIEAVKMALKKGSKVVVITSGGNLEKLARENNVPVVKVKGLSQTRYSFPVLFTPVLKLLSYLSGAKLNLDLLKEGVVQGKEWMMKLAEELATSINGVIPVFYASKYFPIAIRFKQEVNENAKYPAFYGEIPEVNHNEIESYANGKYLLPVVIGNEDLDKVTSQVLNARQIQPTFSDVLMNISSLMFLAGVMSIKLAERMGVNPEKLSIIPKARSLTSNLFKL